MKNRIYRRDIPRFLAANANRGNLAVTFYDANEVVVVERGEYKWVKKLLTRIAQWITLKVNAYAYKRLQANSAKAIRESFRQPELTDRQIAVGVELWSRATRFFHKTPQSYPYHVEA